MKEMVKAFEDAGGPEMNPDYEILIGQPYRRIIEYAEREGANYIFMRTHGYSGWNRLVLGSTTERLIRLAPCPVFTCKLNPGPQ